MLFHSSKKPTELQVIHLNACKDKRQEAMNEAFKDGGKDDKKCGVLAKIRQKAKEKANKRASDSTDKSDKKVFVLDFDGDIKASAIDHLREEISSIISVAKAGDEVVLRLESAGGQVHAYGLASAQLVRIKEAGLTLTICVDKVAASGGYMMACVADKVIAAPFAIVGSIGVVSQMPNFHEFLKKHDIDVELFTAGEYKRTVTMFGKNDDNDRAKYQADLDRIHELFKKHIAQHRPNLDIEKLATGEIWFGSDALELGFIDELGTSDAYVLGVMSECDVFALHTCTKPTLAEKLGFSEQLSGQLGVKIGDMAGQALSTMSEHFAKYNRL